jgi:hypothetical protein
VKNAGGRQFSFSEEGRNRMLV